MSESKDPIKSLAELLHSSFIKMNEPFTVKGKTLEQREKEGRASLRKFKIVSEDYYPIYFKEWEDKTDLSTEAIMLTMLEYKGINEDDNDKYLLMIKSLWPTVFEKYILNPMIDASKNRSKKDESSMS